MNIKVGDKVRIKTIEEMLIEGYSHRFLANENIDQYLREYPYYEEIYDDYELVDSEKYYTVTALNNDFIELNDVAEIDIGLIAEVIPQTLDEYIYSLSLEERARWFVFPFATDNHIEYRSILGRAHKTFNEALQATIDALQEEKK